MVWGDGRLGGGVLEVGDKVLAILLLLETAEGHLGAGDVLLGVLKVVELEKEGKKAMLDSRIQQLWVRENGGLAYQSAVIPGDALLLVGVGVGVAVDGAGLATEETVQGRADLVAAASLNGVALRAAGLEEGSTLLGVT